MRLSSLVALGMFDDGCSGLCSLSPEYHSWSDLQHISRSAGARDDFFQILPASAP